MSYALERQIIEGRFKDAMPAGTPIQYGNNAFTPPADGYLRISILGGGSGLIGIGDLDQRRHAGVVDVAIFTPPDLGEAPARALADQIEAALAHQDMRSGTTRITTGGCTYQRVGKSGDWFQINISTPYARDEY